MSDWSVLTAADGSYRFGMPGGIWYVDARTEAKGYLPAAEQQADIGTGQTATVDFTALPNNLPSCVMPATITVPIRNTTGNFTVRWNTPNISGVTYVLEQSKDGGTYTTINTGPATDYKLTGYGNGAYTYRVKATKAGYGDSNWKVSKTCTVKLHR